MKHWRKGKMTSHMTPLVFRIPWYCSLTVTYNLLLCMERGVVGVFMEWQQVVEVGFNVAEL